MLEILKTTEFWKVNSAAHSPGTRNSRVTYNFGTICTSKSSTRLSKVRYCSILTNKANKQNVLN